MLTVVTIDTPELGDRSYLVHDGEVALVVDPQRDIERVLGVADAAGVRITHVAETHIHNDYVSGGRALADEVGATYLVAAHEDVSFKRDAIADGDVISVGELSVSVAGTPGHTPGHVSYIVSVPGTPAAVLSGGSLLYGAVGRTDLVDPDPEAAHGFCAAQLASVRRLVELAGSDAFLYPTHGFGSFCASAPGKATDSRTIAEEVAENPAFSSGDDAALVEKLVSGFVDYPRYYPQMSAINRTGADAARGGTPRAMNPSELAERASRDEYVIDLRLRRAFAKNHLRGTVSFEYNPSFATFAGWVVPMDATISLFGESAAQLARAVIDLQRIGIDELAGSAVGTLDQFAGPADLASYDVSDFDGLAKALIEEEVVVLDVRRGDEWRAGHLDGATHLFVADVPARMDEIPPGPVWVHCASGCRASIAASLLERGGRRVVLIDDDWPSARQAGFEIVRTP